MANLKCEQITSKYAPFFFLSLIQTRYLKDGMWNLWFLPEGLSHPGLACVQERKYDLLRTSQIQHSSSAATNKQTSFVPSVVRNGGMEGEIGPIRTPRFGGTGVSRGEGVGEADVQSGGGGGEMWKEIAEPRLVVGVSACH